LRTEAAEDFSRRLSIAGVIAALLAVLVAAALPASADAKRRPAAPRKDVVERSIERLVSSTPFPSGRTAAQRA
jgi:hypothetical protein